jgi:hypothetical protein
VDRLELGVGDRRLRHARQVLAPEEGDEVLVEFEPDPELNVFHAYMGLRDELSRLLERPVDLVMPSGVRNRYFAQEIATPASSCMARDPRALLADVLDAARAIERFRRGLDLDGFRTDEVVRSGVERCQLGPASSARAATPARV